MLGWLRRVRAIRNAGRLPPPVRIPRIPIKPPYGFKFGSSPPSIDCLIHLDNEHRYRRARRGEAVRILKGLISREVLGQGLVIGRMDASDPRANARLLPRDHPGIFFINERGENEWREAGAFWRQEDGVLKLTR